jgi:predicted AlkP superfamily phosphohydrolase/phosphomutase
LASPSVIVVGLDGAPMELVRLWARAGHLPNLNALMESGASGTLRSTRPATTPVAWPSIYTGANPGRHGAFGFMKRKANSYDWEKTTSLDIGLPCLWDILAAEGLRSGVFFAPYTFPAHAVAGTMITGRGGPRKLTARVTHPASLGPQLAAEFGERELFGPRTTGRTTLGETADRLVANVALQADAILWSLAREDVDMLFAVFDQTDSAAHLFWHHSDLPAPDPGSPLGRVYRAADHALGRILEAAGGDPLVIVCSDHGTHPTRYRVRMPLWLKQHGFLELKRKESGGVLHGAAAAWRRLPPAIRSLVPERTRHRVATSVQPSSGGPVDWSSTLVYPQPVTAEALYLNLAGREPHGAVPAARAAEITEQVTDALRELTAPDGERLVEDVFPGRELFEGPLAGLGPDLVAETVPHAMFAHAFLGDAELFHQPARPDLDSKEHRPVGYHKRDGLVIIAGPKVTHDAHVEAGVQDVAPTILRHLGARYPRHIDGQAIEGAFAELSPPRYSDEPVATGHDDVGLTVEEEAEVDQHLKDLGYIE